MKKQLIFSEPKRVQKYLNKEISKNMLFSQNVGKDIHSRQHLGNCNVFAIGQSDTKLIEANIRQLNGSYVIQDAGGRLFEKYGKNFKEYGYKVKVLNLMDPENSTKYNPFHYVHSEYDVFELLNCCFNDSRQTDEEANNEKLFYAACIFHMLESEVEKNIDSLVQIINNMQYGLGDTEHQFSKLPENSKARKCYELFKEKTKKKNCGYNTVFGNWHRKYQESTMTDEMELKRVCQEKTVIFIMYNDWNTEPFIDFIASLLIKQLYVITEDVYIATKVNEIIWNPIPIHFVINDLANIGRIEELPNRLCTGRMYNIHFLLNFKDINELKQRYNHSEIIQLIENCSNIVYFPSNSVSNLEFTAETLAKQWGINDLDIVTNQILTLKENQCIVFMQNEPAVLDEMVH